MQKRRIKWRRLSELRPYEKNPVHHGKTQIDALAKSIQEFGFTQPVLIDEDDNVVAGHARLLGAAEAGYTEVPTIAMDDLSPDQVKAYRIADNQLARLAQWDDGLLSEELAELRDNDYRLELLGFSVDALDKLLPLHVPDDADDDAPPAPKRPKTRLGDVYRLGDHRLMCGDAEDERSVAVLLAGAVPVLMVTDPPYGVRYDANWRTVASKSAAERDVIANDDRADWRLAWQLFPGTVAYVWHDGLEAGTVQASLHAAGFELRSQIIWAKDQAAISRGHYHWRHEPCFYAVRPGKASHWNGSRKQNTLWDIVRLRSLEHRHPNQKPLECMRRPIVNSSRPGDGVYDPFGGTGTTLIAAQATGRRCFTMELDPRFCDIIVRRWEDQTGQQAEKTEAGHGPQDKAKARGKKASRKKAPGKKATRKKGIKNRR